MQASQVLQHQTGRKKKFFIDLALCTGADCHFETGKDLPQTAATKIEVKNQCMLSVKIALKKESMWI